MKRKPRIFYIGMVNTKAYVTAIDEQAFVGAAAGKMSAVVIALRRTGHRAALVSLPFVGRGPSYQTGRLCRTDGYPAWFLPTYRNVTARKLLGIFSLFWFATWRVRSDDRILFYNHAIEYALAVLVLRVRGIAFFQDIEDAPTDTDKGLRGMLTHLGYQLMFQLSSPRKVTVSTRLAKKIGLSDFIAVQGIASAGLEDVIARRKWNNLINGDTLKIHFGGTLISATGLDLFCSALRHLDANIGRINRSISVIVTGTGDFGRIENLKTAISSGQLHLDVFKEIDQQKYFELFDCCHASLSLRLPEADISETTFPSKVIEITSRGLALVSTRVSDIADIFLEGDAWLLQTTEGSELAEILLYMATHPEEVQCRAIAGQRRAWAYFAPENVGQTLGNFLEAGPSSL